MNCGRCNQGLIFARHRFHLASDYVFSCGCRKQKSCPPWTNDRTKYFVPQFSKEYKNFEPIDFFMVHDCIKNNKTDTPPFQRLVERHGRDLIWKKYQEFKKRNNVNG